MQDIRNVAIIAHVDHGKTTLVDKILHHCELFRANEEKGDLILDNNDQERERGITIFSKNVSVNFKGTKINIIDTPGHADFGGEVERVLNMADGVLLLVDAFEGPMPQTRYVLSKALELGLKPIVVVNKVDKPNCRPEEVHEMVFDLMFNLDATEEQLDFATVYGSAKDEWMSNDPNDRTENIEPLLDVILEKVPVPKILEGTLQMQITSIDYSSYVGRIAIGRVSRGSLFENKPVTLVKRDGTLIKSRTKEVFTFEGLGRQKATEVQCGDICALTGIPELEIGDTVADFENPEGLKAMTIDEPTMSMMFTINNSPFFGKEGDFVTSRHLRDRLYNETERNLAMRVEETSSPDQLMVFGRGIMHLSVLIETMRREGYELQVGRPQVIIKDIDGVKSEPYETLSIDVPEDGSSKAINLVSLRKGDLLVMEPKGDLQHLEFTIPSRGLIGLRNKILTATAGTAIINHRFSEYGPFKGEFSEDIKGAIVSSAAGKATAYAIDRLQDRGRFFIDINEEIYIGQVVGENSKDSDMGVNLIKGKQLTNMRKSGTDEAMKIAPKVDFSLEECMEYIKGDEYLEVTPASLRMRKITFKA